MSAPSSSEDRLLAASRVTGADVLFLQAVHALSSQVDPRDAGDPDAAGRLEALHVEFRAACAAAVEKHLGREQALASLSALECAAMQRYVSARQAMAPALREALSKLYQKMGELEI